MSFAFFGFTFGSVALALAVYAVLRLLLGRNLEKDSDALSSAVVTRTGTLLALIMALMFAHQMENYLSVSKLVNQEATAIGDAFYMSERYADGDDQEIAEIHRKIAAYVHTVLDEEWPLLAHKKLSEKAWRYFSEVEWALLRLKPKQDFQHQAKKQVLSDWDELSSYRHGRLAAASREIPSFFWVLAASGFIAMVIPFYAFSPRAGNLLTIATLAAFHGAVLYFIYAMTNPFTEIGTVHPSAIERIYS
jgi:cytochrome c biogenesis factor